jgi:hypothetical protein
MKWKTLKGKDKNVPMQKYLADWDAPCLSKFQFNVLQFLRKYWQNHVVYLEVPVAGTKMRIDILNSTKRIAVECDGRQHIEFNKHFHNNSRSVYWKQLDRDDKKTKYCELNGITLVRIYETDLKNLSREWFKEKYYVDL